MRYAMNNTIRICKEDNRLLEIRDYLVHLVDDKAISRNYLNQVTSAIRFVFRQVLKQPYTVADIPRPKEERSLIVPHSALKKLVIAAIQIIVASMHIFRLGQIFDGQMYILYCSYFSDLVLPFAWYFLLTVGEPQIPPLRQWYVKAGIVFSLTALSEIGQYFGFYVFGVTFDPLDILAFGAGILIAAFIDVRVLAPNFGFWVTTQKEEIRDAVNDS